MSKFTSTFKRLRIVLDVAIAAYAVLAAHSFTDALSNAVRAPWNSDWVAFATGSHLLGTSGLYDSATQAATVHNVLHLQPSDGLNPFVSPPIGAFLFAPFSAAGPVAGITLFAVLSVGAMAIASVLAFRLSPAHLPREARVGLVLLTSGQFRGCSTSRSGTRCSWWPCCSPGGCIAGVGM